MSNMVNPNRVKRVVNNTTFYVLVNCQNAYKVELNDKIIAQLSKFPTNKELEQLKEQQ